ncbi:hypothetical protein AFR_00870 [Actinoplanes friuliensis DSM 7358]|uniref:Uncharacterized protein n=1 Tax=Actinoplanes friuliensis DSM 7358 TaxID=1246995 RepID=U5VNB6_9ACTN|nr:hypothetical protein AFR_00870 [Actinoplanes friuliensis DSM 7358]
MVGGVQLGLAVTRAGNVEAEACGAAAVLVLMFQPASIPPRAATTATAIRAAQRDQCGCAGGDGGTRGCCEGATTGDEGWSAVSLCRPARTASAPPAAATPATATRTIQRGRLRRL